MRNTRLEVSIYHNGVILVFAKPSDAMKMVANGIARERKRLCGRLVSIELTPAAPPPSKSATSPASITFADMLAALGIPMRHDEWLSRTRIENARDKIATCAIPSWVDRLVPA